ncbi:MAG TPA: FkbM family methyltransferase [Candidatus Nanopelagicales bacterium]|nr:FkbM family methyltransferase [Candidatus Nanopelagicales bacterium]
MSSRTRILRRIANAGAEVRSLPDKRRTIPRWVAFEAMRAFSPVVAVESEGLRYLVSTRDRSVGRVVFLSGSYDAELIDLVVRTLEREHGEGFLRGRTVLDVGANIGTTVLPLLVRHGAGRGIAIEPEPGNVGLLRANVASNGLQDRVVVRQLAVSDHDGTATLELATTNSGDHRVRADGATSDGAYGEKDRRTIEVPVRTLDSVLLEEGVDVADVALLWVDTQGHEGQVLAGATTLLATGVPVCLEYWPYGLRRAGGLDLLHEVIRARYARVLDLRAEGGPVEVPDLDRLAERYPFERYTDLLLLP